MKIQNLKIKSIIIILLSFLSIKAISQDLNHLRYFMFSGAMPASDTPYGNNSKAGHYLNTGDAKIYYEVYGKGKPVVVLHGGIVGSTYEMGQLIDSLSKRYQVIAISTRGHGKSDIGAGLPTYERKAEDVNAIIKAVTKDSVTVLGFSDGAYTGYFLASIHPEKVKKLIAIGAGEWKSGFRTFNNTREVLFNMDSLYFKQQLKLSPEPQRFDQWLNSINKYYSALNVGKETLGNIKCPVLVMAGEKDQNAPLETVFAAYKMIPHAQLSIIPNAPHPAFLVNFPAVWTSILPFLN
jgi:pimeloyl-ACP methyl ester carboxylesterase